MFVVNVQILNTFCYYLDIDYWYILWGFFFLPLLEDWEKLPPTTFRILF